MAALSTARVGSQKSFGCPAPIFSSARGHPGRAFTICGRFVHPPVALPTQSYDVSLQAEERRQWAVRLSGGTHVGGSGWVVGTQLLMSSAQTPDRRLSDTERSKLRIGETTRSNLMQRKILRCHSFQRQSRLIARQRMALREPARTC